jgi:hypothetical protein
MALKIRSGFRSLGVNLLILSLCLSTTSYSEMNGQSEFSALVTVERMGKKSLCPYQETNLLSSIQSQYTDCYIMIHSNNLFHFIVTNKVKDFSLRTDDTCFIYAKVPHKIYRQSSSLSSHHTEHL